MTYLPALEFAREHGLYITLHCGEVRLFFQMPTAIIVELTLTNLFS